MKDVTLSIWRGIYFPTFTVGAIEVDGERLDMFSIEQEWNDNAVGNSCIPRGTYRLSQRTDGKYFTAYQKRWGHPFVYQVEDVPGRSAILLHAGSSNESVRGCIMPSYAAQFDEDLLSANKTSRSAYCEMFDACREAGVTHIHIGGDDRWEDKV